jgi:gamma-glutamyltranspeptidase/glutathione hydrolase
MADEGELRALNASGRSPYAATIDRIKSMGHEAMPSTGLLAVTVPGASSGWDTLVRTCGRLPLEQVMAPAIRYAEEGFPVSELIAEGWLHSVGRLNTHPATAANYLVAGRPPALGEVFKQADLARTLKAVAEGGAEAFYRGEIAERIVAFSQANGGLFSLEDFADHTPTWVAPISTEYHGVRLHECPPNGQGIVALMALNILKGFDLRELGHNSPRYLHVLLEALKLAFADAHLHVTDPELYGVPVEQMLSEAYAAQRRKEIDINKAHPNPVSGIDVVGDTVYLTAADGEGNVVSLINSLYNGFGSGMVVEGTGICLQNRGHSFRLDPTHPNRVEPHKRPYHTIIPAMVTAGDGRPLYSYGVMGGHMQPQGHVQVLINMVDMGMLPQQALDNPRVRWESGSTVMMEPGFGDDRREALIAMGHKVVPYEQVSPGLFGGGQVIRIDRDTGVLMAGTEPRKDGLAIGF